ncbi:Crp/Fnr family transcriptional regulator [Paenibacillaceae bacterium]|nr:Crp/Fnr family transcriptional regulator [Paenibacillaceae bacterium]
MSIVYRQDQQQAVHFDPVKVLTAASNTQAFTTQQLQKLTASMTWRKLEAGAFLFWEGDVAETVYWIRSGTMKLRKSNEDGKELLLSIVQSGDLIAELDTHVITSHRYSAEALESVEVGMMSKTELEMMLVQDGEFALRFVKWSGMMRRRTESKLRDMLLSGKQGALASTLIRLANSFGIATSEGIELHIKLTNTELAELSGTTRENVNRMLSTMKDAGIIDNYGGGMLRIHHMDALRKMVGCRSCLACSDDICRV